jgi:hypothetical protein
LAEQHLVEALLATACFLSNLAEASREVSHIQLMIVTTGVHLEQKLLNYANPLENDCVLTVFRPLTSALFEPEGALKETF